MTHLSRSLSRRVAGRFFLIVVTLAIFSVTHAQTNKTRNSAAAAAADDQPIFQEYRGVQIGWLADEVRKKLGAPADKGDEQDFYVFGEKETAQILYDKGTRKVVAISVDFVNGAQTVLTPQQVFGAEIEAKPDGSKYRLVRYPKVGYWLSYSRTAGDTPIITVTIQKLAGP